jgi:hypothetical protein
MRLPNFITCRDRSETRAEAQPTPIDFSKCHVIAARRHLEVCELRCEMRHARLFGLAPRGNASLPAPIPIIATSSPHRQCTAQPPLPPNPPAPVNMEQQRPLPGERQLATLGAQQPPTRSRAGFLFAGPQYLVDAHQFRPPDPARRRARRRICLGRLRSGGGAAARRARRQQRLPPPAPVFRTARLLPPHALAALPPPLLVFRHRRRRARRRVLLAHRPAALYQFQQQLRQPQIKGVLPAGRRLALPLLLLLGLG